MSVDKLLDDRGSKYGNYLELAKIIDMLWWTIEQNVKEKPLAYDQTDALRMICMKIARIINKGSNPDYADNWRDIAGYATLVADRLEGKSR